jgi:hypothetical protein
MGISIPSHGCNHIIHSYLIQLYLLLVLYGFLFIVLLKLDISLVNELCSFHLYQSYVSDLTLGHSSYQTLSDLVLGHPSY